MNSMGGYVWQIKEELKNIKISDGDCMEKDELIDWKFLWNIEKIWRQGTEERKRETKKWYLESSQKANKICFEYVIVSYLN